MTTQSIQIQTYDYGASLSPVTLHNITTDAVVATADTCAEISTDSGVYVAVFGEITVIAAGVYRIRAVVSGAPVNRFVTLSGVDGELAYSRSERAVELDSAITTQLDTIETDAAASVGYLTSLTTAVSAITAIFTGMTSLPNWLRRAFRKDAGTSGMITAQTEINTGGTATFAGTTDALEAIRDNQGGALSLNDIIAGVQSVSGGIIAAQDASAFYITQGDTWTQAVEGLGNLADKTVVFAIKKNTSDSDTAAIIYIEEGVGLSRLNGATTTAGWGSITIDDEAAGDITLRLESNATVLLKTGTYIDAVKAKESADDRTLRQRGKTIVSGGVIDSIS